jgi:hypothetical protein
MLPLTSRPYLRLPLPVHFVLLASITIRAIVPLVLSGIAGATESGVKETGIVKVYRCLGRSETAWRIAMIAC